MNDSNTSISQLKEAVHSLCVRKGWGENGVQNPQHVAMAMSVEMAELLEHFQWGYDYDIDEVADELADVLNYCFLMAIELDLDVKEIILNKMEKNAIKYPPKRDIS